MDLKSFMGKYDYISVTTVRELGERRWNVSPAEKFRFTS